MNYVSCKMNVFIFSVSVYILKILIKKLGKWQSNSVTTHFWVTNHHLNNAKLYLGGRHQPNLVRERWNYSVVASRNVLSSFLHFTISFSPLRSLCAEVLDREPRTDTSFIWNSLFLIHFPPDMNYQSTLQLLCSKSSRPSSGLPWWRSTCSKCRSWTRTRPEHSFWVGSPVTLRWWQDSLDGFLSK